jgi:hypothetical protein
MVIIGVLLTPSGMVFVSLYYLIRPREHRGRDRQAERLGGREVDDRVTPMRSEKAP